MRTPGIKLSRTLTSLTLAASLFTDPSIAPKYLGLSPDSYLVAVLGLVLYQIAFLLSRRGFRIHNEMVVPAACFLVYALVSVFYRALANQSTADFALHGLMIVNFYFLILLLTDDGWQECFVTAIWISGIAHFVSLLPDPFGFRQNLIAATAYNLGDGGLEALSRRETGLFPAPAMLTAFSLTMFAVAFLKFSRSSGNAWAVLFIAIAIALGLSTFNRSFFAGLAFALLVLNWCSGARIKLLVFYAIGGGLLLVLPLGEYIQFISDRIRLLLDGGIEASQRWTGDTGVVTGFNIFLDYPLFGSPIAPGGGTLQALGALSQVVNPHNALIQVLSIYGLIGGAPALFLYGRAMVRTTRVLADRRAYWAELQRSQNLAQSKMLLAVISAVLVPILMVEPVGEYSFIFLLAIAPVIASPQRASEPRKIAGGSIPVSSRSNSFLPK